MAFTLNTFLPLSSMANADVQRYFLYKSGSDLIGSIKADDYFLSMFANLNAGDIILCVDSAGTRSELVVASSSSSSVTTQLATSQELTASGSVVAAVSSVELNHATVAIDANIANSVIYQGLFIVKNTSASGTEAHTLTLLTGTFDGTNNVATLNAPGEALAVWFDSNGDGVILENIGGVVLS